MISHKIYHTLLFKLLFYIVVFFPLILIFRSATINTITLLLPIFFLIYIKIAKINLINIFHNYTFIYLFFFFSFILINSIINGQDYIIILKSFGNFRYLLLSIIVFFVLDNINTYQKKFLIYLNFLLIVFVCIDIVYQYFFYENLFGNKPDMCSKGINAGCQRFSGVFGNELIAGTYLSQIGILFFSLFYFFNQQEKKLKLNKKIAFFFGLFLVVIITGERNAALILILSFFFFFLFQKKFKIMLSIIILTIGIIFFLGMFSKSIEERFLIPIKSLNDIDRSNFTQKIVNNPWAYHYMASAELFFEKPIFGHGPKSYRIVCKKTKIEKKLNASKEIPYRACATNPHNYLFEFLSENGIVGGIFYIGFILTIINQILVIRKNNTPENLKVVAVGSLILAVLFPFKPSGSFFSTFNSVMLFYIYGFYLYYLKNVK